MKTNRIVITAIGFGLLLMASCSKIKDSAADPNAKQHNEDVSNTKSESDNENTDINNMMTSIQGFHKNDNTQALAICGATIDSSLQFAATPTLTVTFDGTTPCGNPARIRSGQIKIELIHGTKWTDVGAMLRVTHTNYKVTFVNLNNHFLVFNGVKYLTNVDGIDGFNYLLTGAATTRVRERTYDMTVKFENDSVDSWNCARLTTWSVTNYYTFSATVNGDTIIGGKTIDSWGTSRFGTHFTTEMITPWKSGTSCGWWRPTQGKYTSTTDNFSVTATFGVDHSGNAVVSGCGAYGLKLEWNYNSGQATGNAVIAYF